MTKGAEENRTIDHRRNEDMEMKDTHHHKRSNGRTVKPANTATQTHLCTSIANCTSRSLSSRQQHPRTVCSRIKEEYISLRICDIHEEGQAATRGVEKNRKYCSVEKFKSQCNARKWSELLEERTRDSHKTSEQFIAYCTGCCWCWCYWNAAIYFITKARTNRVERVTCDNKWPKRNKISSKETKPKTKTNAYISISNDGAHK